MSPQQAIIEDVAERYSEWLEHAGDDAPQLMIHLLASLLVKEKEIVSYYRKITARLE